jgi:hypothetical protein
MTIRVRLECLACHRQRTAHMGPFEVKGHVWEFMTVLRQL